jgi:HSP20 family protein
MSHFGSRDIDMLNRMEQEMQRIADEALRVFFSDASHINRFWQPRTDLLETHQELIVKVEIAGVKADKISATLAADNRTLVISGERTETDEERGSRVRCYQLEIYFGPFERHIRLPESVRVDRENIRADYRDGILTVRLLKRVDDPQQPQDIPITSASGGS